MSTAGPSASERRLSGRSSATSGGGEQSRGLASLRGQGPRVRAVRGGLLRKSRISNLPYVKVKEKEQTLRLACLLKGKSELLKTVLGFLRF